MPSPATLPRSAGILLHPTSLPGPFGIGDFGPVAVQWIDTLAAMKQTWWQILPLGPTGYGDSPYQSYSAFAGSINFLSPERLAEDGLASPSQWTHQNFTDGDVDFERVAPFKTALVRTAWSAFRSGRAGHLRDEYEQFCHREKSWLDDYASFMAIRAALGDRPMTAWPKELIRREPASLAAMEKELGDEPAIQKFGQFLFDRQWTALKDYAHGKGVKIIGDLPIFVAGDSADVWANPNQFLLDADRLPTVVAGVPPDYFAEDGQHWGNPIYDWSAMAADGYRWWIARVRQALRHVDLIRLDHFRGFAQAWHIPAAEKTARNGKWVDGPGVKLFEAMTKEIGALTLIAEDLGMITPDVNKLRETLGLPGMRVLQFSLGGPTSQYLPHNYVPNTACYTGTHDNDTTVGWYATLNEQDRKFLTDYIGHDFADPARELIRLAWSSVAVLAIAPLQDVLGLDGTTRMNVPGKAAGNWRWRLRGEQFRDDAIREMADMTKRYARDPES